MQLDKTGLAMLIAVIFTAKFFYHLFRAGVCFILYELTALIVNIWNISANIYNDWYRRKHK